MILRQTARSRTGRRAFTLVEVVVALAILCIVSIASIQTVQSAKLTSRQAYENSIAMAFLDDYMENVLGLQFSDIALTGARTIYLLDGIRTLPASYADSTWFSLNTTAHLQAFPELANLIKASRNPEYQVNIQNIDDTLDDAVNGVGTDYKVITVRIRWPGALSIRNATFRSQLELEARRYVSDVHYMDRHQ
jgi:prepilin-type N-terminal cleavage/methylation domain-containing protein